MDEKSEERKLKEIFDEEYSKPLSGHSRIDKTNVLKTRGSLVQVGSILQYF